MCHTFRAALKLTSDDVYLEEGYNAVLGDQNSMKVCWVMGIKVRLRGSRAMMVTAITAIGECSKKAS